MISVQRRGALRFACAYRTVSEVAILVIIGIIRIWLLAKERKLIYYRKNEGDVNRIRADFRRDVMLEWQALWENRADSRWTKRPIKEVVPWIKREHGEVNYFLTQFLSGHGFFQSYLFRMSKVGSPECVFCPGERDDAYQTFFDCDRWMTKKIALETEIGGITPDNIVERMLQNEKRWSAVARFVEDILRAKKILMTT